MRIEHVAIWVSDLERMRIFYQTYFNMKKGEKYENIKKGFSSYFLSFESGARIEIMKGKDILDGIGEKALVNGLTHIAISVGDRNKVDQLTERLRLDGYVIFGEPRITGDGYYESVILDPEGNHIEITE
jgi:lactoylglutathione lyase